jgi:hypothetical protein
VDDIHRRWYIQQRLENCLKKWVWSGVGSRIRWEPGAADMDRDGLRHPRITKTARGPCAHFCYGNATRKEALFFPAGTLDEMAIQVRFPLDAHARTYI